MKGDGILWDLFTSRHPWSSRVRMYHTFSADKYELLSRKCLPLDLLYVYHCHTTQQSSGKGSRANEGQIYVHYRRDLSCFPYGDRFAATSKLSHNVGLNRSTITSFSLWKLELYKVFTVLTSRLAPFSVDTVYLLLAVAQIT